ncbi:MAG: RNA 3'-terminal phosphate cyclase [Pseudomonadota bacterium]
MKPLLEIPGDTGEGGGQIARMAVALAAVTGTPIRLTRIRAKRPKPGLAAQHLTALRAVAALAGGDIEGLALGATEVTFRPGPIEGGDMRFDVGTAGSITLLVQALLPVLLAARRASTVRLAGGTDVRGAPPLDYLRFVLLPLLARFGVDARIACVRRGYYPRGGGEVELSVHPAPVRSPGRLAPGPLRAIRAFVHTARLPEHIALRMRDAALAQLAGRPVDATVDPRADAFGPGGAIVLAADRGSTTLGAGRVAERGVRAEALGESAGAELARDLTLDVALDVHAADQLIVYLALACAAGDTASFTTAEASLHTTTAIWLAERFVPVRFTVERRERWVEIGCERRE